MLSGVPAWAPDRVGAGRESGSDRNRPSSTMDPVVLGAAWHGRLTPVARVAHSSPAVGDVPLPRSALPKRTGRTQAKSDPLDAIRAGREALSREHLATRGSAASARPCGVLQLTRAGAVKAADARRHLKALLVTAPEPLRTTAERAWPPTRRLPGSARSWPSWSGWWRRRCWPARGWPGHRRPGADQLVAAGPAALGGRLGHAGRRRPDRGFLGAGGSPSAEPWRRPPAESGPAPIVMLRERYHQPTRRDVARRTAEGKASASSAAA